MKNDLLYEKKSPKRDIKYYFFDFLNLCKKAEVPAKFIFKLSVGIFMGLVFSGILIMLKPSLAEPLGADCVTEMIFTSAQKVILLGVILAVVTDFILTDRNKNGE